MFHRYRALSRLLMIVCLVLAAASLTASQEFVKVTTLAASAKGHDVFKDPQAVAIDLPGGVLFIADRGHHRISRVDPSGTVTILAGSGNPGKRDGAGLAAQFKEPQGIAIDSTRRLIYVADTGNHVIRRVTFEGVVSTFAGSGRGEDRDGTGTEAGFKEPVGLALDAAGNLYVADSGNDKIRRITVSGNVTTFAGTGRSGYGDGPAAQALFKGPRGIAVSPLGVVFVADTKNHAIRKIANGMVSTVAGTTHGGSADGAPNVAEFKEPSGIAIDDFGNLWIADTKNHQIRRIGADGVTTTVAGDGKPGNVDGSDLLRVGFHEPAGIAAAGAIFIVDSKNDAMRMIIPVVEATDFQPRSGSPDGGDTIRIFGSGFIPGRTEVTFGGVAAASVVYVSSTEILVVTPPGTIGDAEIAVTTPAGTTRLDEAFGYIPPFTALTIAPTSPTLDPGESQQFSASGVTAAGAVTDLTSQATWSSSNDAIATIEAGGLAQAIDIGATTITATYGSLSATTVLIVRDPDPLDPIPPDPSTVAPPLDPVTLLSFDDATAFLYTGLNPIQQGVLPGTIEPLRSSVVRGRVLDRNGQPLPAVRITIADHPELGHTVSRLDGRFDMVVNGGGDLTIRYERNAYLTAERQVRAPWQDFVEADDVVLIGLDANVTPITGGAATSQVARGSVMVDQDGTRRATLLFPAGTTATMTMPDGSTQPLPALNVRATEYTVGANGPRAMPAPLPPQSAYTYCVELTVDEALAVGATRVQFSQPVAFHLENFLGFAAGTRVPTASYDRERNVWVPTADGRVIRITAIESGAAQVDTNGDGTADNLGIPLAERQQLATLYTAGSTLWRVLVTHFTPYDMNFPSITTATDAVPPTGGAYSFPAKEKSCTASGSIIECENQTLGEDIGVSGTPFALHYRSDRTNGRVASRTLDVRLSGAQIPASLLRIELEVSVAGTFTRQTFPATANQTHRFVWDGHDAYGRAVNGSRPVTVRTTYVYAGEYELPAAGNATFGLASGLRAGVPARAEVPMTQTWTGTLGAWTAPSAMLGGWTLTPHHFYDMTGKTLYRGDGSRRTDIPQVFGAPNGVATKVPGSPESTACSHCGNQGTTVGPDGMLYISTYTYIRKITPDGQIMHVAGNGNEATSGEMPPPRVAATAPLDAYGLSIGPDGSLYLAEPFEALVRRIDPDGIIRGVAGGGNFFDVPDGRPALSVQLDWPKGVLAAPDGSVYICDVNVSRVYRVSPDSIINTVAGNGQSGYSGDGGPARLAQLDRPFGIALGADGSLYVATEGSIRRIGPDGIISTIAGDGTNGYSGDGGPATAARIWLRERESSNVITVQPDGSIVFSDWGNGRIRRIDPSGIINTVAGTGDAMPFRYGQLAAATTLPHPAIVASAPDGALHFVANDFEPTIGRIEPSLQPKRTPGSEDLTIADGGLLYVFNPDGRHLRTLNADTGSVLATFSYNAAGVLESMTDLDNNVTRIERSAGDSMKIVAQGGQETELTISPSGYLTNITTAPNESTTFTYTVQGLMRTMTDARRNTTELTWNSLGLLESDRDAEGGEQTLTRTETANGHDIELTTIGGRTKRYETRNLPTADSTRRVINAAGVETNTAFGRDGTTTNTFSDGTTITTRTSADPAWGVQSPFTSVATMTWPSGRSLTTMAEREATFGDPTNPQTLMTRTDRVTVNEKTTTRVFDRSTLSETVTTPMGRTLRSFLDSAGRTRRMEVPGVLPVDVSYDAQGRLASVAQGSRAQTFGYNARSELTSVTDTLGRSVGFEYDDAGRVTKQILPDLREIAFAYDANGNLTSVTPPSRPEHAFEYNRVNLATDYAPPALADAGRTEYIYNVDRELEQIVRPDGSAIDLGYDSGGRLQSLAASGIARSFGYDAAGNLSSIAGAASSLSYQYDGSTPTQMSWSGAVSGSVGWTYDADNLLATESVQGAITAFTYDDDGMLATAGALQVSRTPEGIVGYTLLGNTYERFVIDEHGDLDDIVHEAQNLPGGAWSRYLALDYSRDDAGRITGIIETRNGMDFATGYHYDSVGRLDEVSYPNTLVRYTYDGNGNRTAREILGAASTFVETASYDAQDRLLSYEGTQYTYTPNGELLTKTDAAGTTHYAYDALGNLTRVTQPDGSIVEYLIDAQNRRVGRKVNDIVTHGWLYSDQLRIIAELNATGSVTKRFLYATRTNVPDYMIAGGVTYRIYADHLGSPRAVVNIANGAVAQILRFDEFGRVLTDTNPGFIPFGFAGGNYDPATSLVRFGARDYDARAGRWTAKEPLRFGGGDTNFYAYSMGDPINYFDPNGLQVAAANYPHEIGPDPRTFVANLNDPGLLPLQYPTWATAPRYYGESQECVALTKHFSGAPCTDCWRAGSKVLGNERIPFGTAIATFESGRYPQAYRNSGIYIGQGPKGIYIIDQWPGNLARARTLGPSGEPQNNANAYSVITVPSGTTSSKCNCGGN